jgi:hypothetical protein
MAHSVDGLAGGLIGDVFHSEFVEDVDHHLACGGPLRGHYFTWNWFRSENNENKEFKFCF